MNKNLNKWILWVVLAIIVVAALLFVGFSKFSKQPQDVEEKIEDFAADPTLRVYSDQELNREIIELENEEFIE